MNNNDNTKKNTSVCSRRWKKWKKINSASTKSNNSRYSHFGDERNSKSSKKLPPPQHNGYTFEKKCKKLKKSDADYSKIDINYNRAKSQKKNESKCSFSELKSVQNVPWMSKKTSEISATLVRAHNEIIEFVDYIGPTNHRHAIREKSFEKLSQKIKRLFPDCQVKAFGSFTSKLYLPNADIDLVVIKPDKSEQLMINVISKALRKDREYEKIQMIKWAKVPLIKVIEKATQINFDISFNVFDGIKQISVTHSALEIYPEMKFLIFVLKAMLRQRDLHEPNRGGVGSFLLFCLVLTFLRELKKGYIIADKREEIKELLLSETLIRFFEFYGREFDTSSKSIIMTDGGKIVDKKDADKGLTVVSPHDPNKNVGKAAVKFNHVAEYLNTCLEFIQTHDFSQGESFLKYIVDPQVAKKWQE